MRKKALLEQIERLKAEVIEADRDRQLKMAEAYQQGFTDGYKDGWTSAKEQG